jgi:hypothetical protein
MKFVCDRCGKRYASTDEPVPGRLYRIPCKCGHVILVRGDASGGVMPAGPATAPAEVRPSPAAPRPPSAAPSPGVPTAPSGRPQPPGAGEVPQFDGDPFAAAVAPPAHPAATSASDLGAPGAFADARSKPPAPRDPAIRLEEPTPPSLRQPYPEPRAFAGPGSGLELEPLAGGPDRAPDVPAPDDPFRLVASLGDVPAAPPLEVQRPPSVRPSSLEPPPFARIDRGGGPSADLAVSASIAARLRRKRSRRGLLIALVVGIAAAAAVGAWFFVISRGSTSTTTATVDVAAEAPSGASPAAARRPEAPPPPAPPEAAPAAEPAPVAAAPAQATPSPKPPAERPRETPPRPKAPKPSAAAAAPASPPLAAPAPVQEAAPPAEPAAAPPPAPAAAPEPAAAPAPVAARKSLQPEDVIPVVRARRGDFDACIAKAVEAGTPGKWLGRRVDLLVFVSPTGRVSSAAVDDPEVEPTELGACLRVVARQMVFPPFQGEAVPLALPLRLGKAE